MLRHFIGKEILDSLLNQRFLALAVFSIVMMPLSAFINYEYFQTRKEAFDSQYATYQAEDPTPYNLRAYRAPVVLSALARGTEPFMPVYYAFSSDAAATSAGNIEAQDFSTLSTFGSFDYLFLVQIVFSLLAVLLAFDMIAGEKERGTLRAVLANRVPRDAILFGKLIGGFVVLWLTFLVGSLLLYLVLAAYDTRFFDGDTIARVAFIFLMASVFLAAFYSLGLMVSTFCHSTRTAIVALLVLWVFLQLVIPKAGEKIAAVALPVESQEAIRIEKREVVDDLTNEMRAKAGELFKRVSGKDTIQGAFEFMREDSPEAEQFKNDYRTLAQDYDRQQRDRVHEIDTEFARQKARQESLSRAISLLSPASALTFLVTDAAGTGDLAYQNYRNAVQAQYQVIDQTIFARQRSNRFEIADEGMQMMGDMGNEDPPPLDELPAFEVREPEIGSVLGANLWAIVSLLAYVFIPFLIAYVAFLKYDVR
jgi:ABC-type transport system involved in multi-copper enzyme maturation permease subunit